MLFEYLRLMRMPNQRWVDKPYDSMCSIRRKNKVLWDPRGLPFREVMESFTRAVIRGRSRLGGVWRLYNLDVPLRKSLLMLSFYKKKTPVHYEQVARTPPLQGLKLKFHWLHSKSASEDKIWVGSEGCLGGCQTQNEGTSPPGKAISICKGWGQENDVHHRADWWHGVDWWGMTSEKRSCGQTEDDLSTLRRWDCILYTSCAHESCTQRNNMTRFVLRDNSSRVGGIIAFQWKCLKFLMTDIT